MRNPMNRKNSNLPPLFRNRQSMNLQRKKDTTSFNFRGLFGMFTRSLTEKRKSKSAPDITSTCYMRCSPSTPSKTSGKCTTTLTLQVKSSLTQITCYSRNTSNLSGKTQQTKQEESGSSPFLLKKILKKNAMTLGRTYFYTLLAGNSHLIKWN